MRSVLRRPDSFWARGVAATTTLLLITGLTIAAPAAAEPASAAVSVAEPASAAASAGTRSGVAQPGAGRILYTPLPDPGPPADDTHATRYAAAPLVSDGMPGRIGGDGRYDTAGQIARLYGASNSVIVANGSNQKSGFDALSANYLAGQLAAPIVLTGGATLEPETASAVTAVLSGSAQPAIYVMGKSDSVSDAVVDALNALAASIAGADGEYVTRIGGDGRYATSALAVTTLASAQIGTVDLGDKPKLSLPTAILASGTANADALAAGPLSNAWGLPVLLTAAKQLSPEIAAVIKDYGIKQLIVLGGTDRVSDAVVQQAQAAGVGRIKRIAGKNRFETAATLYSLAAGTFLGPDSAGYTPEGRVFIANGVTGFPDALAVGPLAGRLEAPLLTATAGDLDTSALTYLDKQQDALFSVTALGKTPTVGNNVVIAAKSAAGINILAGPDGTVPADKDLDAQFVAAAADLATFDAKLNLARTYLPNKGAGIGTLYPYMLEGYENDAAGLTQFGTCDVWMDNTLPDDQILDIFRHEYMHVLQCMSENQGFDVGYATSSDTALNGIERGADAGGYLLGNTFMYYVQYGPTKGPLRMSEIVLAEKLLAHFKIAYHVG